MFLNFNIKEIYNSKNGRSFIILGVILLAIGVSCLSKKSVGINVFSWGISLAFLYGAWVNYKVYRGLNRFSNKTEKNRSIFYIVAFIAIALLLLLFPEVVNVFLSVLIGVFLLYKQLIRFLKFRRYEGYLFGVWDIIKILLGIMLIVSPLFLARSLVSILSIITIIFGIYFLSLGIKLLNNRGF